MLNIPHIHNIVMDLNNVMCDYEKFQSYFTLELYIHYEMSRGIFLGIYVCTDLAL